MAAFPESPPPYDEKSPRTPRQSGTNPLGILNFGTPVKKARNITKERTRHETPGSVVDMAHFIAHPDIVKEFLPCLAKGWAPEETSGDRNLCGVYALQKAFKNIMGVAKSKKKYGFKSLYEEITSPNFRKFLRDGIKRRVERTGLQGAEAKTAVTQIMNHGYYGHTKNFSIEELSEFVRYINETRNVRYRVGVVTLPEPPENEEIQVPVIPSAYIVESDDPFKELHYPVLWLYNILNNHWEAFGPNPGKAGRDARRDWKLFKNVRKAVNNGLYKVTTDTQGVPNEYTLTTRVNQWVYQVAPPPGLEPRDGFIYVHTTKGPNSDSWRVEGVSTMDTIRDQEGFVPLANLEVMESCKDPTTEGVVEHTRKPTDFQAQQNGQRTPPPPPPGAEPPTPGPTPGGRKGCTMLGLFPPGGEELPVEEPTPTQPPVQLPPSPEPESPKGPGLPITTQTQEPQSKLPEPPTIHIPEPPVILQPTPPPAPRPRVIDLDTPLTIKTFLARREYAPPPQFQATQAPSLGSRPRLPPGRPKSRTMAEFTAARNQKNDWAHTRFLNFFIADVPDEDETGQRFGHHHDQPYHQDQVLLGLDETYEPGVSGPVRVRTIDEDEGWVHSDNLRRVTDAFGLDANSATTQYSMDPNEAFREDLYPTHILRGLCQGSALNPNGSREDVIATLTAHRMQLGVPLILYRLVDAVGAFAKGDVVRVPGDPLGNPDQLFRAFGLEPHQRGFVRGADLVAEPRSWGARVRPHVHELRAKAGLKWALPPTDVEDLVRAGSGLSLHGVDTPGAAKAVVGETEEERAEREAGFAPAATVVPFRHPGQRETTKDGTPTFFTRLLPSQAAQLPAANLANRAGQTAQTSHSKRGADEDLGGDSSRRRVSQRSQTQGF
ncbi:hypothetical protein VE03_06925 [Pseudogymnoascus sp. 23342-1-I1]|nr:hypothetical protein VE03_06925 [Pseudogymnoascus sp. 23342-1-I1]